MLVKLIRHIILLHIVLGISITSTGQRCKVGDVLINRNDRSRGVVFWVNPEHTGGWMIAMTDLPRAPFASKRIPAPLPEYQAITDTAGYKNTAEFRNICNTGNYAVLNVDFEHGWYIPAIGQLWQLVCVVDIINPILTAHGGEPFIVNYNDGYKTYLSSSPGATGKVYTMEISLSWSKGDGRINGDDFSTRDVRTFTMSDILTDTTLTYRWNTGATTAQINATPVATTTYTVTAISRAGCPVQATGKVFVAKADPVEIRDTIRRGEIYNQNGFRETEPGTYTHTLNNDNGCSTVVTLHLTVLEPLPPIVFNETICDGQVFSGYNFTAWQSGTYTQQWASADGRDSTVILHLTVHPAYNETIEATICSGERYTDYGFDATETGVYSQHFTGQKGCDSTITLNLNVSANYLMPETQTICHGESYNFHGKIINTPGVYYDSLKTTAGCDSVFRLELNIRPESKKEIEAQICQGERYTDYGFNATETGIYSQHFTNREGCDSTVTLNLSILPHYLIPEIKTICHGESYNFHGRIINTPGIYYDSLKTTAGCDSIYLLKLDIRPESKKEIEATICSGERYTDYGFNVTETGTYSQHFTSREGCDSTVILNLNVSPHYLIPKTQTLCHGENYNFHGRIINTPGIYYDSLKTTAGCDSIFTLELNIRSENTTEIEARICQGERYSDYGFDVTEAGTYSQHLTDWEGCDSTVTLNLSTFPYYLIPETQTLCHGENYNFHGRIINTPGIYYDSLKTTTGCDSIYLLELDVRPDYTKNIKETICTGERYTDNEFDVTQAGMYTRLLSSREGCDSTITLNLNVIPKPNGRIQADLEDCIAHSYHFSAILDISTNQPDYFWELTDRVTSESSAPLHSYTDSGEYIVKLTLNKGQKCSSELTYPLTVPYYPESIQIYSDRLSVSPEYPEIELHTDPFPGISYRWNMGDGTVLQGQKINHTYPLNTADGYTVRLTATNSDNCVTEQTERITIDQRLIIPNTFSPNGDGINDVFMSGYQVKIRNRNGVTVYRGDEGWDGNYKGSKAPEDVYFYILYLNKDNHEQQITGYIHLTR